MANASTVEKNKYLFKNTFILFVSNFSSKILVFFMLPLYTSVLTATEYGISDLITTTVNILYIFLTLYISNGIIRYTMNSATDPNEMFSIGALVTIMSSLVVILGSGIAYILKVSSSMEQYYGYLVCIYFFHCLRSVLTAFAKGKERIRLIGISGIVSTAVRVSLNILLLVVIPLGIQGYLLSAVFSHMASCVVYVKGELLKETRLILPKKSTVVKIVKYSAPIAATEVGWLVCTSSDKYIVLWLLGASATGIISAAHRLPTILTAFTSVFIQAWTLSAIKEADKDDKTEYYSQMFNYYNAFAITVGAILILLSKIIGSFLFRGEFVNAWIYTPIYLTALVINTISSFSGSIISAGTDTRPLFTSTVAGACLNLILDILLIKYFGIFGAGIATAVSYLLIGSMRMTTVKKKFDIRIEYRRMWISILFLSILTGTMILADRMVYYIFSVILVVLIMIINRRRLLDVGKILVSFVKRYITKA